MINVADSIEVSSAAAVTILECREGHRLAKRIEADGTVTDYSAGFLFRAEQIPVENLDELADLLEALAGDPTRCVIRGAPKPGAEGEWVRRLSRDPVDDPGAVAAFEECARPWVCIDLDSSVIALDPADPAGAVAAWRASLPEPLRGAGMVFQLSSKAHLYPYLRGHGWIWLTTPVDDRTLRAWYAAQDFDPALAQAVQLHYTADPEWAPGAGPDPYAGRRVHRFAGPAVTLDLSTLPEAPARGTLDARTMPDAAPNADVLDVLGPAADHEGHKFDLCGALGGVWRRMCWSADRARATIEAWLEPLAGQGCDVQKGVRRCLGAWEMPFDRASGSELLITHLGGGEKGRAWAERVARASKISKFSGAPASGDTFAPVASTLPGDPDQPLTLSAANNQMYFKTDTGYVGPYAHTRARSLCRALGIYELVCKKGDGDHKSYEGIYDSGTHVEKIVRDFGDARTWFDGDSFELHHGYELPAIEPVEDPAVAAWLVPLAGAMLPHVLEWIRSCRQEYIGLPAAALVIVGPPGIGKTVIFRALARMWGARSFVPLSDSIAQFNGTITRCPIVADDECKALKSRKVTSAEFRERVQATERDFELKGKEKIELHGCTREGITANDLTEVAFTDVRGSGVVDALRDRLLVVECTDADAARAALAAVRGTGDREAELARITGHIAWIWATAPALAADAGRFIGAGGSLAETVALAGVAAEGNALWESLARFLDDPAEVPEGEPPPSNAGWFVWKGELWASPTALARCLAMSLPRGWAGREDQQVTNLVRAVAASTKPTRICASDGKRPSCYLLDLDRVIPLVK